MQSFGSFFSYSLCALPLEKSIEANSGEFFQSNPEPNCWWQSSLSHGTAASQSGLRLGQPLKKTKGWIVLLRGWGDGTQCFFFSNQLGALYYNTAKFGHFPPRGPPLILSLLGRFGPTLVTQFFGPRNWGELRELLSVVKCNQDSEKQVWHCVKESSEKAKWRDGLVHINWVKGRGKKGHMIKSLPQYWCQWQGDLYCATDGCRPVSRESRVPDTINNDNNDIYYNNDNND